MKRLYLSLVLLCTLSVSSWAAVLYFPQNLVEFPNSGDPQPDVREGHKYYRQYVWWSWSGDMTDGFDLSGSEADFIWSVDVTGDITIASGHYLTKNGTHYELSNSEIYFDGSKGTITLTATNPDFGGVPYTASYTISYHAGVPSKRWDFNTKPFTTTNRGWEWGDEEHMSTPAQDHPAYTPYKYALTPGTDGSYLVNEAAGLKFEAPAYCFGFHNPGVNHNVQRYRNSQWETYYDENKDANVETRFICFKAGSKLTIPATTFSDYSRPRVRIKMNRDAAKQYVNWQWQASTTLNLKINNGADAEGKPCNQQNGWYGIGGSAWWGRDKGDYLYRGEYHFQVIDKTQDFSIEVPGSSSGVNGDAAWLMIYTIEVYDSDEMITENDVLGEWYQYLTTEYKDESGNVTTSTLTEPGKYWVHYRGKAEKSTVSNCTTSGTVGTKGTYTGSNFINRFVSDNANDTKHTYTPVKGEYGSFRMRLDVHDHNNNYVTDYAYRTQSVGLMENKNYPYTWDFTDIKAYQSSPFTDDKGVATVAANKMQLESQLGYAQQPDNNYTTGAIYVPRNVWDTDGAFRIANNGGHDVLFAGGSQLWYGTTIIPETAGLGFTPVNYDGAYNGAMTITDDGLLFDQNIRDWWLWRIMIPQVDNKCTIYVRAKKLRSDSFYNVGYYYGDATNATEKSRFSTDAISSTKKAREIATDDNDVIYAIPAPTSTTNVTLFFQGVEVHKIAVSKDNKHVNKYGWATESRDHVIDPELTSYFSNKNFEHCTVTNVNYSTKKVTLLRNLVTNKKVLMKSNGSDNNASIIHNKENKAVDILAENDGFHLFVPDIHDYVANNEGVYNQKTTQSHEATMKAQLSAGDVSATNTDGTTNFVLTYDVAYVEDGVQGESSDIGYVGFFRVQAAGVHSPGNQGYLPIQLGPNDYTNKFTISWGEEDDIDATIINNAAVVNDNVFYNLNGQKVNGVPTTRGIYIINGKKIVVK